MFRVTTLLVQVSFFPCFNNTFCIVLLSVSFVYHNFSFLTISFIFDYLNLHIILVAGNWSDWFNKTGCSAPCGTGNMTIERFCNNSAPVNNGDQCLLENGSDRALYESKIIQCNTHQCPRK